MFKIPASALFIGAILAASTATTEAGIIAGFYSFTSDPGQPGRDSSPNLSDPGVSAAVQLGAAPQSLLPSIKGAFIASDGSKTKNFGTAGTTGPGDNGNNGFIEGSFFSGVSAFLEITNTSLAPLGISSILLDAVKLQFVGGPASLIISWSIRAANYTVLSPVSSAQITPTSTFAAYSAAVTGVTLAPTQKLVVNFQTNSTVAAMRLDNIAVDGAFAALTAVPETSTVTGLGVFLGLATSFRARRRVG